MKGFTEKETELLLSSVVAAKKSGQSLSFAFSQVASKTNRAKGSIRNYYYMLIKDDEKKNLYSQKIEGVNSLKSIKPKTFTKEEEKLLIEKINQGKMCGQSVRKTILNLSGGDNTLALRLQNKYRNHIKKEHAKLDNLRPEDFKYFDKLSREIDGLVEKIKDKYSIECAKLKRENELLSKEIKALRRRLSDYTINPFFIGEKHSN